MCQGLHVCISESEIIILQIRMRTPKLRLMAMYVCGESDKNIVIEVAML